MIKLIKLRQRILFGYAVPIVIMFVVAGLAYHAGERSIHASHGVYDEYTLLIHNDDIMKAVLDNQRGVRGFIITGDETFLSPMHEGREAFARMMHAVRASLPEDSPSRTQWDTVETLVAKRLIPWQDSLVALVRKGTDSAQKMAVDLIRSAHERELMLEISHRINSIDAYHEGRLNESRIASDGAMLGVERIVFLGAGVGAVVAILASLVISSGIVKTINETVNAVSTSSTQIAATIDEHERTATQQAAAVNQTSATMDELGASSRQSAEQAETIAHAARQSLALAEGGTRTVAQTLAAMSVLKEKVGSVAEQILRLSERTSQIGSITNLVGDLANQTNLLALNAAVEAARAGEHGRGFAVVAGEIRKLADQSKKSAERINALVLDIQKSTNSTVMATEEGTKTVEEGIELVNKTGEAFNTSSSSINSTFESIQQISLNMKQQALAIRQVVDAMNSLNIGAKETSIGITQTKSGVQTLVDATHKLKAMV